MSDRPDVVEEVAEELDVDPYLGLPSMDNHEVIIHALKEQAHSELRVANVMEEQLEDREDKPEEVLEYIDECKRKAARYLYIANYMEDSHD